MSLGSRAGRYGAGETRRARRGISRRRGGRDRASEKRRLGVTLVLLTVTWLVLIGRLWVIQVSNGERYAEIANRQSSGKIPIPVSRGVIFDRTGREVALDIIKRSISVYPRDKAEARAAGRYLDRVFAKRKGFHQKNFAIKPRRFRWVKRGVDDKLARRIISDSIPGVYVREERGRKYPFGVIGKQILGYTDIDDVGISGIETRFNETLQGLAGVADIQRDGLRNTFQVKERPLREPQPGKSLALTIDWNFQEVVEEELAQAVKEYSALGGTAIFLDCRTGEILAAAHYDPSEKNPDRPTKLKPITDCFEPGSIYKVITAAAILDQGKVGPDSVVYCEDGQWRCGRRTLHDDEEHGDLSFHEIITYSSNIGVAKLALGLGGPGLVEASRRFGIAQKTRVQFPGEPAGLLNTDLRWSDYNIAALSIGHSVAVTPLQMALMMAAVANGGDLLRPRLIRGIIGENGVIRDNRNPEILCRALKESSARILRSMLASVVDSGTATKVKSEIVSIAGKTGTAEKPRSDGRGYYKNKFIASFAGYFPTDSPQIAGIITLDEPEPVHYGGHTSGPTFRRIAERYSLCNPGRFGPASNRIYLSFDEKAEPEPTESNRRAPRFVGLTVEAARRLAKGGGYSLKGLLAEGDVLWQYPPAGEPVSAGVTFAIQTLSAATDKKKSAGISAPDMIGLSFRQAALLLHSAELPFRIEGSGQITRQFPAVGSIIKEGQELRLVSDPQGAS